MGILLTLRGDEVFQAPLSQSCIGDIERLRAPKTRQVIAVIFGDSEAQAGMSRNVDKQHLAEAVARLIPVARLLVSGGFEVRISSFFGPNGPVISTAYLAKVNGKLIDLSCNEDYWTVQPFEEMGRGIVPKVRHYESAEFFDEKTNGTVKIEPKTSKRSDLFRILRKIKTFVSEQSCTTIEVTWG